MKNVKTHLDSLAPTIKIRVQTMIMMTESKLVDITSSILSENINRRIGKEIQSCLPPDPDPVDDVTAQPLSHSGQPWGNS